MTEEQLLLNLINGDRGAFKVLVDTYKNMVFNTVLGFIPNTEDAEDVTQNIFIKVFETLGSFKQQSKLSTWIYRVSVNESLDFTRNRKRKKRWAVITSLFGADNELLYQASHYDHPGIITENKEKAAILFGAIDKLPDNQKTAFLLQKTQDRSQKEIAEIMNLTEGAIESLLIRAKTNLKKQLIDYYTS